MARRNSGGTMDLSGAAAAIMAQRAAFMERVEQLDAALDALGFEVGNGRATGRGRGRVRNLTAGRPGRRAKGGRRGKRSGKGQREKVLAFLKGKSEVSRPDLLGKFPESERSSVGVLLTKLKKEKAIENHARGMYRSGKAA